MRIYCNIVPSTYIYKLDVSIHIYMYITDISLVTCINIFRPFIIDIPMIYLFYLILSYISFLTILLNCLLLKLIIFTLLKNIIIMQLFL